MNDILFEPITINKLVIKNRIFMPAMHLGMCVDYQITDQVINFYKQRAKGGVGIIAAGYATIDQLSGNTQNIGAHDDKFIPGLERLATTIKNNGSKAVIQLNHSGRYNFSFFLNGKQPVAPSPIASRMTREVPHELTIEEIQKIIESFANAALRVKKAGFDGVEILSGTGYLISEFLSPLTNKREDQYGGTFENRVRFGLEIMQAVKKQVGNDFPLIVRMNGNDFMIGGQEKNELIEYAKALNNLKIDNIRSVDAICVNVGWHEARVPQIITQVPKAAFAYLARGIKEAITIPVIASHRINDLTTARELIGEGMCDMVAMGRSLIADPDLPRKGKSGQEDKIIHCIACAQGCFDNLFKLKFVECLCNPRAGHEAETVVEKTTTIKNILIAGGGAAGMSAALASFERGHKVTLYEKEKQLGGQLFLAAAPPGREEFINLVKDLASQVAHSDIHVNLNSNVDEDIIKKEKPDAVILTTGAIPNTLPIPGIERNLVVQAWDILSKKTFAGKKVVIIGGGAVGVETALFLAEQGTISGDTLKFLLLNKAESIETLTKLATSGSKEITLIEMTDKIGRDIGKSTRWGMLQDVKRNNISTLISCKALEITEDGVLIEYLDKTDKQTDAQTEIIQADTVVLATGAISYNPLQSYLEEKSIPFKIAGDAKQIALAFDAVHQGFKAGREI